MIGLLDELELTVEQFASRIGLPTSAAQNLLDGNKRIDYDLAKRLSVGLGASQEFWISRECDYRESLGESASTRVTNLDQLMSNLPVVDMIKFGWIEAKSSVEEKTDECLNFFNVSTFPQWLGLYENAFQNVSYRRSQTFSSLEVATVAWLRQGEIETQNEEVESWSPDILRESIKNFKRLTWYKDPALFVPKLKSTLSAAGVKLAIVRAPRGCSASGAVRILDDGTPLIQLSFRYLSDDQFWFSFFHEIGHLLLHYDKMPIFENDEVNEEDIEDEANRFAEDIIVPHEHKIEFQSLGGSRFPIIRFAKKVGVAPGLIVGQLQHANIIKYSQMQHLKRRYRWSG